MQFALAVPLFTLNKVAVGAYETSVNFDHTKRRHKAEDSDLTLRTSNLAHLTFMRINLTHSMRPRTMRWLGSVKEFRPRTGYKVPKRE
jgi:hypothetical protein